MNNYDILGVSPKATKQEIRKAYHKMSMIYHPDVGGNSEQFIKIKNAYDELMTFNPNKTHNIHQEHEYDVQIEEMLSMYYSGDGSMSHTFLVKGINMARVIVKGQVVQTWRMQNNYIVVLSVPKKTLIMADYKYDLHFTTIRGGSFVYHYQRKDPRSTLEKLADKYLTKEKIASFIVRALFLFIIAECIHFLIKHT